MGRFKISDIDNESFYQIPKSLFTNENYKGLGLDAKVIYSFLKDRMELSRKNNWKDENGDIYLLFTQEEIANLLDVSLSTISRAMKYLKEYDLIEVVRQGLSKPNKIYIRKISVVRRIKTCTGDVSRPVTDESLDLHPRHANETDISETDINTTTGKVEDGEQRVHEKIADVQKVFETYQNSIHPIAGQIEVDMLTDLINSYSANWVYLAIKEALRNNVRNMKYIESILRRWHTSGMSEPWNQKKEQVVSKGTGRLDGLVSGGKRFLDRHKGGGGNGNTGNDNVNGYIGGS